MGNHFKEPAFTDRPRDILDLNNTIPYLNIDWWHLIVAIVILVVGYLVIKVLMIILKRVGRMHLPELLRFRPCTEDIAVSGPDTGLPWGTGIEVARPAVMSAIVGLVLGFGLRTR